VRKPKTNSPTTNPEEAQGIRVFVYGTLKWLHCNHHLLEAQTIKDSEFLGACYITGPYRMRDLIWYPGVQLVPDVQAKNRIYGEVYRIGEDTLKSLDILEGNGSFFTRSKIDTPWKKAWMYMIPPSYDSDRPVVGEGVWKPNAQEKAFIYSGAEKIEAPDYFAQIPKL
jgi:gamma-glutamylcyclotransferase (GGCT)/AIG2-like uncharacterized protein YtfP